MEWGSILSLCGSNQEPRVLAWGQLRSSCRFRCWSVHSKQRTLSVSPLVSPDTSLILISFSKVHRASDLRRLLRPQRPDGPQGGAQALDRALRRGGARRRVGRAALNIPER